jgi:hypothetical protein
MRFHRTIAAIGGAAALLLTAAPAGAQPIHITQHSSFQFSEPTVAPCDPSITAILTVQGEEVLELTNTGQTFQLNVTAHAWFTFDPDDPNEPSSSGHAVVQHRDNVNYSQLQDRRITDTQHTIVHVEDGTNFPVQITTTLLISTDGTVEVKIDSIRCGGQSIP